MGTKTQMPEVTIGMPVYNGSRFISEALDSLLAQTYRDFQLIISDNASTDNTELICKKYSESDSRISYVRQDKNIGMVSNFQFVLDKCNTKYFMWAAYDDLWSPNWIAELLQEVKVQQCVAIGLYKNIDKYGNLIDGIDRPLDYSNGWNVLRRLKFIWYIYPLPLYGLYRSDMIKRDWRDVLGKHNGTLYLYRKYGDNYLLYIILKQYKIVLSNACIRYGRVHESNSLEFGERTYKKQLNITNALFPLFTTINPIFLWAHSNAFESFFVLPICVFHIVRNLANEFTRQIKKAIKKII